MKQFIQDNLSTILENGGIYIYPLMVVTFLLWYFIGYRFAALRRGTTLPVSEVFSLVYDGKIDKFKGVIDSACKDVLEKLKENAHKIKSKKNLENLVDEVILEYDANLQSYKSALLGLTVIAPLLGLLGTVDGMVTMFNSLNEGTFFSQGGGGIALGISKALYTTEIGLIIAIPGIITESLLLSKQRRLQEELKEIRMLALSKFYKELEYEKV
ncbi:MAG: MotA/TolQ/ExbB proton channel family protein [Hydrogenothermaceae bacterium]|nr:MotA/TolQ/ExbB proton channel family protein [Hydrogenothermaceae bacterium]